jgi:hypothetical protein
MMFQSSGMWRGVVGCVVPDVAKDHCAFSFRVKQSKKNALIAWHCSRRQCGRLKQLELLRQQHSVTLHKTGILSIVTVRCSNLVEYCPCLQLWPGTAPRDKRTGERCDTAKVGQQSGRLHLPAQESSCKWSVLQKGVSELYVALHHVTVVSCCRSANTCLSICMSGSTWSLDTNRKDQKQLKPSMCFIIAGNLCFLCLESYDLSRPCVS